MQEFEAENNVTPLYVGVFESEAQMEWFSGLSDVQKGFWVEYHCDKCKSILTYDYREDETTLREEIKMWVRKHYNEVDSDKVWAGKLIEEINGRGVGFYIQPEPNEVTLTVCIKTGGEHNNLAEADSYKELARMLFMFNEGLKMGQDKRRKLSNG